MTDKRNPVQIMLDEEQIPRQGRKDRCGGMDVMTRGVAEDFKDCSKETPQLLAKLCNGKDSCGYTGKGDSDLSTLFLNSVQDGAKGRLGKATVEPGLLIILVSRTQSFRAIIEGIAERFVNALQDVASSHEHLQ